MYWADTYSPISRVQRSAIRKEPAMKKIIIPIVVVVLLALGLGAGLVAHFVFGVMDAVALGSRPNFLWWMAMGMCGGLLPRSRQGDIRSACSE